MYMSTFLGVTGGAIVAVIGVSLAVMALVAIINQLKACSEQDARVDRARRRDIARGRNYREGRR